MSDFAPSFLEFFAGAGLARFGLGRGWRCLWANDIDTRKTEIYRRNFGEPGADGRYECPELVEKDVFEVSAATVPAGASLAWASFPCQDLSLAGWQRGMSAGRSGTFWAFWRIMDELHRQGSRPNVIVIENVTGLLYGPSFAGLCQALAALGMQFGALTIDARLFLPQSRPRVFIVAVDEAVECADLQSAWPKGQPWFSRAVFEAWGALPRDIADRWRWWSLPLPDEPIPELSSIIDENPLGVEWSSEARTAELLGMMSPVNRKKIDDARRRPGRSIGFLYKRMRDGRQRAEVRFDVAGCLRTPNGGSSRQTVLLVEGGRVRSRLLAPREAARLMGYPDCGWLPDRYNDAYRAMGDAVAVPVVEHLTRHLLRPLAGRARVAGGEIGDVSGVRQAVENNRLLWERTHRAGMSLQPRVG